MFFKHFLTDHVKIWPEKKKIELLGWYLMTLRNLKLKHVQTSRTNINPLPERESSEKKQQSLHYRLIHFHHKLEKEKPAGGGCFNPLEALADKKRTAWRAFNQVYP